MSELAQLKSFNKITSDSFHQQKNFIKKASILGESSSNPASLADPFSSQHAGTPPSELNVSRSSTGDTMHDSSQTQAAASPLTFLLSCLL